MSSLGGPTWSSYIEREPASHAEAGTLAIGSVHTHTHETRTRAYRIVHFHLDRMVYDALIAGRSSETLAAGLSPLACQYTHAQSRKK